MILVRHGESQFNCRFNVTRVDPGITDPALTPVGLAQARRAGQDIAKRGGARKIISSPYWRTLQTAEAIAEVLGLEVTVEPLVRERAYFTCDIGSPSSALRARWPGVSFRELDEVWWPPLDETDEGIRARGHLFREQLRADTDWRGTVVVTHWGFIRALTGETVSNGTLLRFNPEDGSFEFLDSAA